MARLRSSTFGMAAGSVRKAATRRACRALASRADKHAVCSPSRSAAASIEAAAAAQALPPRRRPPPAPPRSRRASSGPTCARDQPVAEIALRIDASRAGARRDRGMAGQIDGVGDQRRRGVGDAAVAARTVTASAMPSEKLRPRQPEVAIAAHCVMRRGSSRGRTAPGRSGRSTMPIAKALAGRQMQRDVAAIVDIGAAQRRGVRHRREDFLGDGAGDRGHRRDETRSRETARRRRAMRRATTPARRGRTARGARSSGNSAQSSSSTVAKRAPRPPHRRAPIAPPRRTPRGSDRSGRRGNGGARRAGARIARGASHRVGRDHGAVDEHVGRALARCARGRRSSGLISSTWPPSAA